MKKHILSAFIIGLIIAACGPQSRENTNNNDGAWLYTDGRSQLCMQELRVRGVIPAGMPVQFYPDNTNIVQVRQNNPGVYSVTESEYKGLCRSVGIELDGPSVDSGGGRRTDR